MTIHVDPKFGHVRVLDDRDVTIAEVFDFGSVCHADIRGDLTPAEAIDVGRALIKWAGNVRKRRGGGVVKPYYSDDRDDDPDHCRITADGWCMTHSTASGPAYCDEGDE